MSEPKIDYCPVDCGEARRLRAELRATEARAMKAEREVVWTQALLRTYCCPECFGSCGGHDKGRSTA